MIRCANCGEEGHPFNECPRKPAAPSVCAVPHCGRKLYPGNTSGVCRDHNHLKPHCKCIQCSGGRPTYRLRTRQEMIDAGYLPRPKSATG